MRNVFVVVHTESQHHIEGRVGGWYDSELSPFGHEQAQQVAAEIHSLVPAGAPCSVHSSDLARAAQTAEPIASLLGAELVKDPGLREMSYGAAEGRPEAWLKDRFVPAPPHNRLDHDSGIDDAETKRQFALRIYDAVDRILDEDVEHQVIVTHGFALTFVVMAWARVPIEAAAWVNLASTPGGITHLNEDDFFHNRGVRFLNKTAHLSV